MAEKINAFRAKSGLGALRDSPSLTRSATRFAHRLMRSGRFGHAARIHASRRFSRLGEVLAWNAGWRIRRSRTVRRWLRSPSHRSVLLSGSFRYVGVGRARGYFRGRRATIWVAQFGA